MSKIKLNKEDIITYYEECEVDYKLIWHLNHCHAMHLGYWDETTKGLSQALDRENEILAEMARIKKTDQVLDAGCGVGGSAIFLAKKIGCQVTGITITPAQVKSARLNAQRHQVEHLTTFYEMDFCKTSFKDSSFDVVWGIESICHADSKKDFIQEAYRLLKKGGRLIIADGFATHDTYKRADSIILNRWLHGWGVNFLETAKRFKKYLHDTGFVNVSYIPITENIMPSIRRLYLWSFPALFFGKIAEYLKIRNKIQSGNVRGAYYQYKAIKKGLWEYGIMCGEKV